MKLKLFAVLVLAIGILTTGLTVSAQVVAIRPGQQPIDPELSLQREVFRVLLQNNPDRGLELATQRLQANPDDPVVIGSLSHVANSTSTKALPLLVSVAKNSTSGRARNEATHYVARTRGDKDALVTMLLDILASAKDQEQQSAVANGLAEINTPRSVSALAEIARDKNRTIEARRTAISSVGRNDNPNRLTMLVELYQNSSDSVELRRSIMSSISRIPDAAAVQALVNIAKTETDLSLRRSAVQYLGNRKEPEAIRALEEFLKTPPRP